MHPAHEYQDNRSVKGEGKTMKRQLLGGLALGLILRVSSHGAEVDGAAIALGHAGYPVRRRES